MQGTIVNLISIKVKSLLPILNDYLGHFMAQNSHR